MSSGGGGGQSGVTRYDWNPVVGGYWGGNTGSDGLLGWGTQIATQGYTPYGAGPTGASRVADFNNDQYTAMQRTRDLANAGGPPDTAMGRAAAGQIASGAQLGNNPYGGMGSPYFDQTLNQGLGDITNAYKLGTAADTTRMFNLSGAFGGSAHQNAIGQNEAALGKNLSQYTSGMQNDQYNRSAGLYDNSLARQMQAIPLSFQGQQLATDLNNQVMGIGQAQQGQNQNQMNDAYNRWTEAMNYGRNNLDWLGNLLGRAQGSTGVTTTQAGYQPVNYGSAALGAGLLGSAFLR